jgi:predicted transcriptional regulator
MKRQIEELGGIYHLSDEERAGVRRGFEEMHHGKFASDEDVKALFGRYRGMGVR